MSTYLAIRDGVIRARIPDGEIRDGVLVGPAGEHVIDAELAKADGQYERVRELAKARQWNRIDRRYIAGPGTSASGLLIIEEKEWRKRERQRTEQSPGAKERAKIEQLYLTAERQLREGNIEGHFRLRTEADRRLAAWRAKCPRAAAAEYATELQAQANHVEQMAVGAMVYDCDGSLSQDDREQRAANYRAKATDLKVKAERMSKNAN